MYEDEDEETTLELSKVDLNIHQLDIKVWFDIMLSII
jgi:hypothetical protein